MAIPYGKIIIYLGWYIHQLSLQTTQFLEGIACWICEEMQHQEADRLIDAAARDDVQAVSVLLDEGIPVNTTDQVNIQLCS